MPKPTVQSIEKELNSLLEQKAKLESQPSISDPLKLAEEITQRTIKSRQVNELIVQLRNLLTRQQAEDERAEAARVEAEKAQRLTEIVGEFEAVSERLSAINRLQARELLKLASLYRQHQPQVYAFGGTITTENRGDGSNANWLGDPHNPGREIVTLEIRDNRVVVVNVGISSLKSLAG